MEFKRLADSVPVLGSIPQSFEVWRHAVKGCGRWMLVKAWLITESRKECAG